MSQQKTILKASGLYSDPNLLSEVPEGSLVQADNVIIDRDNVISPRRGMAQYGNTFGTLSDRSKQLMTYKQRVLRHYNDTLEYNSVTQSSANDAVFLPFSGSYLETEAGLRIKYAESNKNLYFTTSSGIKKIAARTAADFTTAPDFIVNAGVFSALDLTGQLNFTTEGFLPANSKVAYRVVWGYKDINDNLLLGSPSSRLVITNYSTISANVDLQFTVPQGVTENYFYRIYRTAIFTSETLPIDTIEPDDVMNLVFEDAVTVTNITNGFVSITDISPDDFRQSGEPLYTNGAISQANEPPPIAKDVTMYQNTLFYANIENKANTTFTLLGIEDFVSMATTFTITNLSNNVSNVYTFVGEKEITKVDFSSYIDTIPFGSNGKYFLMNSANDLRKYYVYCDTTITQQKLDFTSYIGTLPTDLDGRYSVFYSAGDRVYYVWFDATGTTTDPGLDPLNTDIIGAFGIKVTVTGLVTKTTVCGAIETALNASNIYNDYDVLFTPGDTFVDIITDPFEDTLPTYETIQKGFAYTITSVPSSDPAHDPISYPDVVGRAGFRVLTARGVLTKAQLADAMAAAILEQDNAADFLVTYTPGDEFFDVSTTNNGNTTDASDSAFNGFNNGFTVTTTQQGDGQDPVLRHVLLSAAATPAQQIDETARSLVNIINRNASEIVNATYISGPNDLPGKILLQARNVGISSFRVSSNVPTSFNPPLNASGATLDGKVEIKPNRLMFAKLQQPEAVPSINFIDIGPEDQAISRILALRESLFILKTDGVYRLTGLNGNYSVDLFDNTTKIISPDTAVVINNQIYCLTNQGVAVITDTGVNIISKELDNIFQLITSSNYNYKATSFGISYETDRAYILFVPQYQNAITAEQAYRWNTTTETWTRFDMAKTCGIVSPADNKLYLGAADANFIERERKNFDRTDYADREVLATLVDVTSDPLKVTLNQSNIADVGDAIVQTQYLTISQFNQFLRMLDLDTKLEHDYLSSLEIFPFDLMTLHLNNLASKLDSDPQIQYSNFANDISVKSATGVTSTNGVSNTTITKIAHGLKNGRFITVSASTNSPSINGYYPVTVINADTFTIPVITSNAGTCNYNSVVSTSQETQGAFNIIINQINVDAGVSSSNYPLSTGTYDFECLIDVVTPNLPIVQLQFVIPLLQGPITIFKRYISSVVYTPETFGDPSVLKQVREGTVMFEDCTFTRGTVGYKTDLSPHLETINFNKSGKGDWGIFIFSNQNWGGGFSGVPLRTYIPVGKQRCRYIQAYFGHTSAREKWAIFGISYTLRGISERAYRG